MENLILHDGSYLAMGVLRVDFRRFMLCDAGCGALVVSVFFLLSYDE